MDDEPNPVVLVVEDEPAVAESFELMLRGEYDVRVASDGEAALDALSDEVDVVLLDRMMPGMSGDEVLEELRDRGTECRVAMVTAVDPDFDIIEMGFDDYVPKPPTKAELRETVADLVERSSYAENVRRYHSLLSKRATLQTEKPEADLEASESYAALQAQITELEADLEEPNERLLDDAEFVGTLRELTGDESSGGDQ
jgi:two-component system response regulator AdeR